MKKLLLLFVGLISFLLCTRVYAETSLSIECDSDSINEGKKLNCKVILNTTDEGIKNIGFDINTGILKYDGGSCSGSSLSSTYSGSYNCKPGMPYTDGSKVISFTIEAPSKFINAEVPLKLKSINIYNDSNTNLASSSTYEKNIRVNGSVSSSGIPSAKLELSCPYYYVCKTVECDLILNLDSSYYTGISFEYSETSEIYSFSYNDNDFSSSSNGTHNSVKYISLNGRTNPFVGKTVVGKLKFYPQDGKNTLSLNNVKLYNGSNLAASGGILTNNIVSTYELGKVDFQYTGEDRPRTLKDLKIDGKTIANFSENVTSYTINVNKSSVKIEGTAKDPSGIVQGNGTFNLKQGLNTFTVTSFAACGNRNGELETVYTININNIDDRSSDNSLKELSVSNTNLEFSSNKTEFSTEVSSSVTKVTISSTLNDPKASYVKNYGNRTVDLKYGSNTFLLKVKAENESVKEYKIIINRIDDRSNVNTLKSLSITNAEINFDPNTTTYKVDVKNDIDSVKITSELSDSKSSYVKDYGNRTVTLKYGSNTILVKVKAENESVKEYKIVVNREDLRSKVNTLSSLEVTGYTIDFKPEVKEYSLNVETKVTKITLKSELTDPKSSYVKNYGNRTVDLKEGNNEVLIKVKAENESVNEYKIKVYREYSPEHLKNNTSIKEIKIGNLVLESKEDGNYTYILTEDKDKLDLDVLLVNSNAKYEIVGNSDIKDGSVVKILVTSEDKKETKEYFIEVSVTAGNNLPVDEEVTTTGTDSKLGNNKMIFIIGGAIFAVILVLGLLAGKKEAAPISVSTETDQTTEVTSDQNNKIE